MHAINSKKKEMYRYLAEPRLKNTALETVTLELNHICFCYQRSNDFSFPVLADVPVDEKLLKLAENAEKESLLKDETSLKKAIIAFSRKSPKL